MKRNQNTNYSIITLFPMGNCLCHSKPSSKQAKKRRLRLRKETKLNALGKSEKNTREINSIYKLTRLSYRIISQNYCHKMSLNRN